MILGAEPSFDDVIDIDYHADTIIENLEKVQSILEKYEVKPDDSDNHTSTPIDVSPHQAAAAVIEIVPICLQNSVGSMFPFFINSYCCVFNVLFPILFLGKFS